jgi:hypothetical protein
MKQGNMMRRYIVLAGVAAIAAAAPAAAVTMVFNGQDDGAPVTGPFTNSVAAQAQFLAAAAAYGPVVTEGFETAAQGFYSPLDLGALTVTYATGNSGPGLSGVNTYNGYGNFYGFNTTPGGSQWLGFPDYLQSLATFELDAPTHAFGFFTTGVQSVFTTSLTVQLVDGSMMTFTLPINIDGGVSYFGLVDTVGFTKVVVSQANLPGYADAWGVDDVSYTIPDGSVVPEPATWAMLVSGFGAIGLAARRRRTQRSAS